MVTLSFRFSLLAFSCALVFGLSACVDEPEPAVVEEEPVEEMPAEPAAAVVDVDGTISALEGGITNLAPSAALANIDAWIAQLGTAEFDERDDVLEGLQNLRAELASPPFDGDDIGEILEDLGESTAEAGTEAGNAAVTRLGELLSQAGEQLDDL